MVDVELGADAFDHGRSVGRVAHADRTARETSADAPVAVVSGAGGGLGLEIVRQLAEREMRVVLASRSAASGRAVIPLLGDLAASVAVRQLDATESDSVAGLTAWLRNRLGRCDVLVNIATTCMDGSSDSIGTDLDAVRETLERNLIGTWRLTQAIVPLMRARQYGRIVNISGSRGLPGYDVSMAAVDGLTRIVAADVAADGILVNSYWPDPGSDDPETPVRLATLPADGPTGAMCTFEQ